LTAFLENAVSLMPAAAGRFPQVSGLCFIYDLSLAAGARVTSAVRTGPDGVCSSQIMDLSNTALYSLIINDFMAAGGDGHPRLKGELVVYQPLVAVVSSYVKRQGSFAPALQGRITCASSGCPAVVSGQPQ